MPAASACAVSSPAVASGTCRPPPTTCASYTGSLSAAPDQPPRGTPTATGPSSGPPEARQGRLPALLDRFKRQRPAIQQQPPWLADYSRDGQLHCHVSWHLALCCKPTCTRGAWMTCAGCLVGGGEGRR